MIDRNAVAKAIREKYSGQPADILRAELQRQLMLSLEAKYAADEIGSLIYEAEQEQEAMK